MSVLEPDGRPLAGTVVRLDAGRPDDAAGLFAALDDPRVYAAGYGGGPAGRPASVEAFERWWAFCLHDARRSVVYVVRLVADGPAGVAGAIVGTSSLGDASPPDERIHLGWTAYAPIVWGSRVNPECKLLRDTVVYSILRDEWPAVRDALQARVRAARPAWNGAQHP